MASAHVSEASSTALDRRPSAARLCGAAKASQVAFVIGLRRPARRKTPARTPSMIAKLMFE
jgi:hypothetical protein